MMTEYDNGLTARAPGGGAADAGLVAPARGGPLEWTAQRRTTQRRTFDGVFRLRGGEESVFEFVPFPNVCGSLGCEVGDEAARRWIRSHADRMARIQGGATRAPTTWSFPIG